MDEEIVIPESQEQVQTEDHSETEVAEEGGEGSGVDSGQETLEAEASAVGWKKGGALDAETYLAHKEVLSSKERNSRLIKESQELKTRLEEQDQRLKLQEKTSAEYREFQAAAHKREVERLKVEANAQIAGLEQQQAEAIRNGDGEEFLALKHRIKALDDRKAEVAEVKPESTSAPSANQTQTQPPNHPEFAEWVSANDWFKKDPELNALAEQEARILKIRGDTSDGKVFFDKVKEEVRKQRPEKFGNQNRSRPGAVDSGSNAAPQYKGKTVADLPDVARSQMKEFISHGMYAKEAKAKNVSQESLYLKEYFA